MLFRTPRAFCVVLLSFCTLFVCETLAQVSSSITAVWANDGEDKVTQDELRASSGHAVTNSLWDGTTIKLFGAKNEVVNFNLILEAASTSATNVAVTMSNLNGPSGSVIRHAAHSTSNLFDWTTTESATYTVPIRLIVRNFTLPDVPNSKTMLFTEYGDVSRRYTGVPFPNRGSPEDLFTKQVLQAQLYVAHRHKLSLIDDNFGQGWSSLQPAAQWQPFLSGTAFTSANGYVGPGVNNGQDIFSIGTYGGMTDNPSETQDAFTAQFNGWESWFEANSLATERFVYLCDEINCQNNTPALATQLQWWQAISGVGHNLHTLATQPLKSAVGTVLSNPTSTWPNSLRE